MKTLKIKGMTKWKDCANCNKIKQIGLVTKDHDPLDKIMFTILLYQREIKATRRTMSKTTDANS